MQFLEIFILAIGLSFDTFAVSVSAGITNTSLHMWQGVKIAIVLTFFQAAMPLIGWLGGLQIISFVDQIDHWLAFGLLTAIGSKMIADSWNAKPDTEAQPMSTMRATVLLSAGFATSIDALVVGITFAFVELNIILSVVIIGVVTFFAAMLGMLLGKKVAGKLGKRFEIIGGVFLIGIGIKFLLQHFFS